LPDDDRRQSGKSRRPSPELGHPGLREDGLKPRVTPRELFHCAVQIGLCVEAINRAISQEAGLFCVEITELYSPMTPG